MTNRESIAEGIRVLFPIEKLETIQRGKLTVGYSGEQPTDWLNSDKLAGIHGEVRTRIADMLGLEMSLVQMSWPSMLPAVHARSIDIPGLGSSWTEERQKIYSYTQPFQYYFLGIMQPIESAVVDAEALKGHKIGVISGCFNNPELEAFLGSELVASYDDLAHLAEDVLEAKIEFGVYDLPNLRWMLGELGVASSFHVLPFGFNPQLWRTTFRAPCYLVFDGTAINLRTACDLALDYLKTSGELHRMYADYGFADEDLLSLVGPIRA